MTIKYYYACVPKDFDFEDGISIRESPLVAIDEARKEYGSDFCTENFEVHTMTLCAQDFVNDPSLYANVMLSALEEHIELNFLYDEGCCLSDDGELFALLLPVCGYLSKAIDYNKYETVKTEEAAKYDN